MEIIENFLEHKAESEPTVWFKAAPESAFSKDGGECVKYNDLQIAVFHFSRLNRWYACQNLCPHKMQMILSRGMIGTSGDEPKVACPFHKKTFSLESGKCLNSDEQDIVTYPVKVENGYVYIGLNK